MSQQAITVVDQHSGTSPSNLPLIQLLPEANSNDLNPHNPQPHDLSIAELQQPSVIDPPTNALFNDPDTPQDNDHSHHDGHGHHSINHQDHHKHKDHSLENYQLPEDVLLKISPRGHSSGPVIISQVC